jgi:hypothetical protein
MTKKKEPKKTSVKEEKPVKHDNKRTIFDGNGKLIVDTKSKKPSDEQIEATEKYIEESIHNSMRNAGKKPPIILDELQEKKRQRWRQYYSLNKEKYQQWNKNWRDKQKKEKQGKKEK